MSRARPGGALAEALAEALAVEVEHDLGAALQYEHLGQHLRLGALGGAVVHDGVTQHERVELLIGLAGDHELLVLGEPLPHAHLLLPGLELLARLDVRRGDALGFGHQLGRQTFVLGLGEVGLRELCRLEELRLGPHPLCLGLRLGAQLRELLILLLVELRHLEVAVGHDVLHAHLGLLLDLVQHHLGLRLHLVELHLHLVDGLIARLLLLLALLLLALLERLHLLALLESEHLVLLIHLLRTVVGEHHRLVGHLLHDRGGQLHVRNYHVGDLDALLLELVVEHAAHIFRHIAALAHRLGRRVRVARPRHVAQRRVALGVELLGRGIRVPRTLDDLGALTATVGPQPIDLEVLQAARHRARRLLAGVHQLLLEPARRHAVHKGPGVLGVLSLGLVRHDAEDHRQVDLHSHVVGGLAPLDRHVEDHALLRHEKLHPEPRWAKVEASRPDRLPLRVVLVLTEASHQSKAAVRHGEPWPKGATRLAHEHPFRSAEQFDRISWLGNRLGD
mmetsp:Transcript_16759/g.33916  ORF Transcript_16759/g.33916 Transcript_16759/m.33916 type:complete len:506 (-) Transcript_16759:116-1633(-)